MQAYLRHIASAPTRVEEFFREFPTGPNRLLLDGTGMISSYQNAILRLLGRQGLERFDEIHAVSGSAYAYFIFEAMQSGDFLWGENDVGIWNQEVRSWHGVTPVLSYLKFLTFKRFKAPAGHFGGHRVACDRIFTPEFNARPLSSFSARIRFWTYDLRSKRFVAVSGADPRFAPLRPWEVISLCTAVPAIFGAHRMEGSGEAGCAEYIDAMYAPGYGRFIRDALGDQPVLHPNMIREGSRGLFRSFKIHEHPDGLQLIRRDFTRFLLGRHNPDFDRVTRFALFGRES